LTYLLIRQRSDEDFPNAVSVREAAHGDKNESQGETQENDRQQDGKAQKDD
jgi:hypothetical protein